MPKGLTRMDRGAAPDPFRREDVLTLLGRPAEQEPPAEARAELLATIQEKIIPRLVLAHAPEHIPSGECAGARLPPTEAEVVEFSVLAIAQDVPRALAFIEQMSSDGLSLEVILLHLIAPAARQLGKDWEEDVRPFTEVTIGLSTLQQVVHILGPTFAPDLAQRGFVVLVSPHNEQHTLGIYLLGEFLRRAGWGVQVAPSMSEAELVDLVEGERVDMVGISVSNSELLVPLTRYVGAVRKASMNPDMAILLGGSLLLSEHAEQIGGTFCSDPRDAVRWLEDHVRFKDSHRGS